MNFVKNSVYILTCLLIATALTACAGDKDDRAQTGECTRNADCEGGICDTFTNTCQRPVSNQGTPDAGTPDAATPQPDATPPQPDATPPQPDATSPQPDIIEDAGPDIEDDEDAAVDAADADDDVSEPISAFSGCRNNTDCAGFQTCNVGLGRCEDVRNECTSDGQCAGTEVCLAGLCTPATCHPTNNPCLEDLECVVIDEAGGVGYCVAICEDFDNPPGACAPDTHCMPYLGRDFGFCRGFGTKATGDDCEFDFSADTCQSGKVCLELRGSSTCHDMCSQQGSLSCGADSFCSTIFDGLEDDGSDDAGACFFNCGGLADADDTLCGQDEQCYPLSSTEGFCQASGTVAIGGTCRYDGTAYCEAGSYCNATGVDAALGSATQGICMGLCDPNVGQCGSGQSCFKDFDDADFGVCAHACDPTAPASTNGCPVGRERCWPSFQETLPVTDGFCRAGGDIATASPCQLDQPLSCNADDLCVDGTDFFGGATGTVNGTCTRYCLPYDDSTENRCPTGQVCAPRLIFSAIGFCTTLTSTIGTEAGDSCDDANTDNGLTWCGDNLLCLDWRSAALTCEALCYTDVPHTCPTGQSCVDVNPADPDSTFGYCE
ncbi:MAG: hypothetical protein ACNA8W_02310 [Bradymonadaceae bacterium]